MAYETENQRILSDIDRRLSALEARPSPERGDDGKSVTVRAMRPAEYDALPQKDPQVIYIVSEGAAEPESDPEPEPEEPDPEPELEPDPPTDPPAEPSGDVTLYAGRMNRLSDPDIIAMFPQAVPQGDGTAALDLNGLAEHEPVTLPDGRVVTFKPRQQDAGWGEGRFYYLAKRADGRFDVRPGERHRKVYVTNGPHGLTAEQIAPDAPETVTGKWLMQSRPDLGTTPETALTGPLGFALWHPALRTATDSGEPVLDNGGGISGSSLESSNTDISEEFTKLIVTQQAYSAGTRIVSTADEMLQEALNMIR